MVLKKLFAVLTGIATVFSVSTARIAVNAEETYEAAFEGVVTDAGEYVSAMTIDFKDKKPAAIENDTFEVLMTSTVDYGAQKGNPYAYYDASKPLPVVKTEVSGTTAKVYFKLDAAPVLTWLGEGRNFPAVLGFTITQKKEIKATTNDGRELTVKDAVITTKATSWKDLANAELKKFKDVQDEINYQFYKGTNDKLIVFFHGNGEGDFEDPDTHEMKLTNNNAAQILANRGGAAWVSEEAQAVFGDASVMAFQAPSMWYYAVRDNLLETAYNEIMDVIKENNINSEEVYLSGASAGGYMSTRMVIAYPDLFKAAMINCPALDAADTRSGLTGSTPTDEELAKIKDSRTRIWLVQGETDSSVSPELCAKRIWDIVTKDAKVSEKKFEGDQGIASGFTTYETDDNKYKLSLYETVDLGEVTGITGDKRQGGKLKFAEDYDLDGKYEEVKYSDHWSWIYTLRNNPEAANGTHIWEWAVYENTGKTVSAEQIVNVKGDDWGPSVDKVILTFEEDVEAEGLNKDTFKVREIKEAFNWATFQPTTNIVERQVTDVYLCDEKGEKAKDKTGKTAAVELYISPNDGSPFYYELFTGFNRWVDQYRLEVYGEVTQGGEKVNVSAAKDYDFYDNEQWISEPADSFKQATFTASDKTPIVYGEWVPEAEEGVKKALVIWLHGAGEGTNKGKNDNYIDLLGNEVTALVSDEFQNLFGGAYVVTPQAPTMWMDDGKGAYQSEGNSCYRTALKEFIDDYVAKHENIDKSRIIIGGCSNGGYMTIEMVLKFPGYFYKAYPICEAYTDSAITDDEIKALAESRTGIWFTYAKNDGTVDPTACSEPTIKRLRDAGKEVHVSAWEDVHDTTGRFTGEDGKPHQYNGHWSWIYFDNNENKCDECGLNEWEWLAMQEMHRLYNPNSGEHFYTAKAAEKDFLVEQGWQYENIGWVAPGNSETPVYRLYNANGGEHHYTMNAGEKDALVGFGWTYEGIGWHSDDAKGVPLYREYNPNMRACNHNYTTNKKEHDYLVSIGWKDEGTAWYGVKVK
ncbi:MAG TPA: hypothetical protein DHW39_01285 [Erysipelotrichaceae bacterium]|nr:hypothetical protein [Erysipelotrichaceae bacterium]